MSMISGTGSIRSVTALEDFSISTPVYGDWNNDGWNDIVLIGTRGYYGYALERRIGTNIFVILMGVLITVVVIAFIYNVIDDGGMNRKKKALRNINLTGNAFSSTKAL